MPYQAIADASGVSKQAVQDSVVRNLTTQPTTITGKDTSQRALVAAKLANMRQGERTDIEPSANLQKVVMISQSEAAEMLLPLCGDFTLTCP